MVPLVISSNDRVSRTITLECVVCLCNQSNASEVQHDGLVALWVISYV